VRLALLSAAAVLTLAGCGNDVTPPPNTGLIPGPKGFRDVKYPDKGITLRAPTNWRIFPGTGDQVATIAIGDAQISIWSYARTDPLPETRAQLGAARKALIAQVHSRDSTFDLKSSRLVVKTGLRGVELVGAATNQGERRAVRSLHAYGNGHEVIVDSFAPPKDFARVDGETFGPVARSLRLRAAEKALRP
jgi:hypothetical protein